MRIISQWWRTILRWWWWCFILITRSGSSRRKCRREQCKHDNNNSRWDQWRQPRLPSSFMTPLSSTVVGALMMWLTPWCCYHVLLFYCLDQQNWQKRQMMTPTTRKISCTSIKLSFGITDGMFTNLPERNYYFYCSLSLFFYSRSMNVSIISNS